VLAASRGSVQLYQQFPSGAGYYIVMNHGGGHRTRYLHLSSRVVADNQLVARGQLIGYEGMTGDDDNHLHFETRYGATTWPSCCSGTAVDPYAAGTYMWETNPPSTARDLDWSGDGYSDVLARKPNGELCLFAGNGNSGWNPYPDPPCCDGLLIGTGWQVFDWILRPGDWSGDGCHDILARTSSGFLYLYYGNCATGFTGSSGVIIGSGWQAFNWLLGTGDFSGDRFNDILARKANGELCMFRGNGYGGWIADPDPPCGDGTLVGTGWNMYNWLVAPSDFGGNGDPCPDVVTRQVASPYWMRLHRGSCGVNGYFIEQSGVPIESAWKYPRLAAFRGRF
jgi:hypothetical protein